MWFKKSPYIVAAEDTLKYHNSTLGQFFDKDYSNCKFFIDNKVRALMSTDGQNININSKAIKHNLGPLLNYYLPNIIECLTIHELIHIGLNKYAKVSALEKILLSEYTDLNESVTHAIGDFYLLNNSQFKSYNDKIIYKYLLDATHKNKTNHYSKYDYFLNELHTQGINTTLTEYNTKISSMKKENLNSSISELQQLFDEIRKKDN
jgi:hypothetical protein